MNILGIVLLGAIAALTGYLVYTLIRDVRIKIIENKSKGEKKK